ncbi:MAG: diadenylate cyclase [Verrucomicrobiales bacterium]|nr:diadenylate cyclase [Verrucomicrobiales bacterium]
MVEYFIQHWKTVLEVVIISGGIAVAYLLLRRTAGTRVLLDLISVLLGLTVLSYALNLELMKNFLGFFVLALVILFQSELRHAFVSVVGDRLFTPAKNNAELIEQLDEVIQQLAKNRLGALFAFERGMNLKQILETGVEIDGKFTPSLVLTIFSPKTTLHDGGMILHDGRIAGAGCLFPVSQREMQDRTIGLRHRAALGITEQTDAIAVAVSEESGKISIAHAGQLERGLSSELFKRRLSALLSTTAREKDSEPAILTEKPHAVDRPATMRLDVAADRPATKRLEPRIELAPAQLGESRIERTSTQRLEA